MMKPEIKKGTEAEEFETQEHCYIIEVANDSGDELVSITRARVKPGVTTGWHRLKGVSERYIIITGNGIVEVEGLNKAKVSEGDVVRIPSEAAQRITNTGKTDLVFYCVCSPPFTLGCYEALE
jgi:mannose-6-phosphate isomerase-like protein (cupin superfamily)